MKVTLPQPGGDWLAWARRLLVALTEIFERVPEPIPIGGIIRWPELAAVPRGYLQANGATYSAAAFPALARVLPETTPGNFAVPTIATANGAMFIIRAS